MIIVCAGDSFTYGMELWEEKNVPEYLNIKTQQEAFKVHAAIEDNSIETQRFKLAFSGHIEHILGCKVYNVGKIGSSELDSVQRAVIKLAELKNQYPNEKILCLLQDTGTHRFWIWHYFFEKMMSMSLPNLEQYWPGGKEEAFNIKEIYLKYQPNELIYDNFYMSQLALQKYCIDNEVEFLHFHVYSNHVDSSDGIGLEREFFNRQFYIDNSMTSRLESHFGDKRFYLPGMHVNCEAHKLIASWLVEEMKDRKMI